MFRKIDPPIEGKAYPKLAGKEFGYRCCIKGEWYDCDKNGNIKLKCNERIKRYD